MYIYLGALAGLAALALLYYVAAPGPRRGRAYAKAKKALDSGNFDEALAVVETLRPDAQPALWRTKLRQLAGESRLMALDAALKENDFEHAFEEADRASMYLDAPTEEHSSRVVEAMLAEVRRLFSLGHAEADNLDAMIARTGKRTGTIPAEARFFRALSTLRAGDFDGGLAQLLPLYEEVGRQVIDVPLYLGMLLHRLGRPQEALRYLGDANRIDGSCPFVTWQLGITLVVCNGDSAMAVKALQRALGPRGLPSFAKQLDRLWVDTMPEGRSYVRRLATRYRYACPLLGADLGVTLRQGRLALAQALYRQERWQESADLYGQLLQDSAPTAPVLRGYGLALARLGSHDLAYKHLRSALEQEDPKDNFTAAYLALCGAMGRPTNPDDKPRNVLWSLKLLAKYPVLGNKEWAGIVATVHAEARRVRVAVPPDDLALLCDALASVQSVDVAAGVNYSRLLAESPESFKPIHAWLYARAASAENLKAGNDLDVFARAFSPSAPAREFFARQGWDFAEVEYAYLRRTAEQAPGRFPAPLGDDYPEKGHAFLLGRSAEFEKAGKREPARESAEILLKLAPASVQAHDRLACLSYRVGDVAKAVELLEGWKALAPADPWPVVRQAVIEQERGNADVRAARIADALSLTTGDKRAAVAFLGARLALRVTPEPDLAACETLLDSCLGEQPSHADALWCLAAVRSARGDKSGLAALAGRFASEGVAEGRYHYFAAVSRLAAGDYVGAARAAELAAKTASLGAEARFVQAWAFVRQGDDTSARQSLAAVVTADASPSVMAARALLGVLCHKAGDAEGAVTQWTALDAATRAKLSLDEPLRQTVLLAGLDALDAGRYESAAERFREAGRLSLRDRRLGSMITLALVKAGRKLLYPDAETR